MATKFWMVILTIGVLLAVFFVAPAWGAERRARQTDTAAAREEAQANRQSFAAEVTRPRASARSSPAQRRIMPQRQQQASQPATPERARRLSDTRAARGEAQQRVIRTQTLRQEVRREAAASEPAVRQTTTIREVAPESTTTVERAPVQTGERHRSSSSARPTDTREARQEPPEPAERVQRERQQDAQPPQRRPERALRRSEDATEQAPPAQTRTHPRQVTSRRQMTDERRQTVARRDRETERRTASDRNIERSASGHRSGDIHRRDRFRHAHRPRAHHYNHYRPLPRTTVFLSLGSYYCPPPALYYETYTTTTVYRDSPAPSSYDPDYGYEDDVYHYDRTVEEEVYREPTTIVRTTTYRSAWPSYYCPPYFYRPAFYCPPVYYHRYTHFYPAHRFYFGYYHRGSRFGYYGDWYGPGYCSSSGLTLGLRLRF